MSIPAISQTATSAQLAAAALSSTDLPGFHVAFEQPTSDDSHLFSAGWHRVLAADDEQGTGDAAILVVMLVPEPSITDSELRSTVTAGYAFSGCTSDPGFRLLGPIGVGDVDQAAAWEVGTMKRERGTRSTSTRSCGDGSLSASAMARIPTLLILE
jgi:hypothetical protein